MTATTQHKELPSVNEHEINSEDADKKVTLTLTLTMDQADAVSRALDLYTRISIGQVYEIADLARTEFIQFRPDSGYSHDEQRRRLGDIDSLMIQVSRTLGYSGRGHSMGIGNSEVPLSARQAYEIEKVLDRALAMARNPDPMFRGVNYNGLTVRYTTDPAPTVAVTGGALAQTQTENDVASNDQRPTDHGNF